jgi:uncharacterized RDD family membrane protein YckC
MAVGARGAERVARVTGVDRAVNQAVEEAIVRALRSPAVIRAIARAVESDAVAADRDPEEIAAIVRSVLASHAAADAWDEVLQSDQVQMLVERIAGAPEIRSAITSQGAGLLNDMGVRLTVLTERLDDAAERLVRPRDPDSETVQAGLATRTVAAAIDLGLLFLAYSLVSGVLVWLRTAIFGTPLPLAAGIVWAALGLLLDCTIFATFWSLAGQTPGMRFLSIRIVYDGRRNMPFRRALWRAFASVLALLPLGLGYLAILRSPQRRGWNDRMAGTEVIYDAAARSAPHAGVEAGSAAAARHRATPSRS